MIKDSACYAHSCLIDISWPSIFAWRLRSTVEVYQWEEQKSEKKSKDSIGHMAIGTYELLRVGSDYYMASGDVIFFETSWEWFEYPQIWGKNWEKLYAKSKIPTVGWYDGMKQFQYTKFFKFLIPWEFLWNEPIQWDGNRVFFLLLTNLFYQLDPNEMIARFFLFFLARVAIFLTCFQKKLPWI